MQPGRSMHKCPCRSSSSSGSSDNELLTTSSEYSFSRPFAYACNSRDCWCYSSPDIGGVPRASVESAPEVVQGAVWRPPNIALICEYLDNMCTQEMGVGKSSVRRFQVLFSFLIAKNHFACWPIIEEGFAWKNIGTFSDASELYITYFLDIYIHILPTLPIVFKYVS